MTDITEPLLTKSKTEPPGEGSFTPELQRTRAKAVPRLPLSLDIQYYGRNELEACDVGSLRRAKEVFRLASKCEDRTVEAATEEFLDIFGDAEDYKADLAWSAEYKSYENSRIRIHAVHMAAAAGNNVALEAISSSSVFGSSILNAQCSLMEHGDTGKPHYTPLMSALFMGKVATVLWLLDKGASAQTANADGFTACHLLAHFGLSQEAADDRIKNLRKIILKLVEKRADMSHRSGQLKNRTDSTAVAIRNRTPLDIAKQNDFPFPKQALHLLTKSYHSPAEGELFKEVHTVAEANPKAAEHLLQQMRKLDLTKVRQQLAREVEDLQKRAGEGQRSDGEEHAAKNHIALFIEVLRKSPAAGVKLLDLLMMEPHMSDPQRYHLPLYSVLPNDSMLCTYQSAARTHNTPTWGMAHLLKCMNENCSEHMWKSRAASAACRFCKLSESKRAAGQIECGCQHCYAPSCLKCAEDESSPRQATPSAGLLGCSPPRRSGQRLRCPSKECRSLVDSRNPRNTCSKCGEWRRGTVTKCRRKCGYCLCEGCEHQAIQDMPKDEKPSVLPEWHKAFKKELPDDPLAHRNVHEVLVRVLQLPGIINLDVLGILSAVPHDARHKSIFGEVSVKAIITCVWELLYPSYLFAIFRSVMSLLVLLGMGLFPVSAWACPRVRLLFIAVLVESAVTSCLNLLSGFLPHGSRGAAHYGERQEIPQIPSAAELASIHRSSSWNVGRCYQYWDRFRDILSHFEMRTASEVVSSVQRQALLRRTVTYRERSANTAGRPKAYGALGSWTTFLWFCGLQELINILVLGVLFIGVAVVDAGDVESMFSGGPAKVLVTSNVLWQCFNLMSMLRTVQLIGPLILAVVHSFVPMRSMFLLMGAVFATFSFVFVIIRDPERSVYFVLVYLWQALVLADRDTSATISGLDMAREQTLDFGQELFNGEDDPWILQFSLLIAVIASSLFSLVLLNLTIGMYTKFYEKIEGEGDTLFLQMRAKRCFCIMLQFPYRIARLENLLRVERLICIAICLFVLLLVAVLMELHWFICSVLLSSLTLMCQVVLLYRDADIEDREHYLWVSYRSDYERPQDSYSYVRQAFAEASNDVRKELDEIRRKQSEGLDEIAELRRSFARFQERFNDRFLGLESARQSASGSPRARASGSGSPQW